MDINLCSYLSIRWTVQNLPPTRLSGHRRLSVLLVYNMKLLGSSFIPPYEVFARKNPKRPHGPRGFPLYFQNSRKIDGAYILQISGHSYFCVVVVLTARGGMYLVHGVPLYLSFSPTCNNITPISCSSHIVCRQYPTYQAIVSRDCEITLSTVDSMSGGPE